MLPVFLYSVAAYFPLLTKITTIFEEATTIFNIFRMVKDFGRISYSEYVYQLFKKKLTVEEIELDLTSNWVVMPGESKSSHQIKDRSQSLDSLSSSSPSSPECLPSFSHDNLKSENCHIIAK